MDIYNENINVLHHAAGGGDSTNHNNSNFINNNNDNLGQLMEPWGYNLAAFILFLIGFFGFSLNLFVIILMCKDVQLWTPMNIILFNLVCSDFLVSIVGNPFTLTAALSHKWIFGNLICIAYGFFMSLLGITSITTLTVLAYERYCLVKYPLTASRKINKCEAVISVFLIWSYSLALTTPPLFGWGAYVNEAADISCSINWETQTFNATTYIMFLFTFGLVVPVIVISFSYINIIITMKTNSDRLGRKNRGEKRITAMVAVMILAFLIAWSPYAIFALIEQFGPSDLISPQMAVLPALIAKSSICYNPLIYVGLNTQFRASWQRQRRRTGLDQDINPISQTNDTIVVVDCRQTDCRQNKREKFCLKAFNRLRFPLAIEQNHNYNNIPIPKKNQNTESSKISEEIVINKNVQRNLIDVDENSRHSKKRNKNIFRKKSSKKCLNVVDDDNGNDCVVDCNIYENHYAEEVDDKPEPNLLVSVVEGDTTKTAIHSKN